MAIVLAAATGNWDAPATWVGGVVQVAGDVAVANGKNVTVNVSVTVAEVRNDTTGGATAGGRFELGNGVTLTANAYSGTAGTSCIYISGGNSANFVGNVTSNGTVCVSHGSNGGTLTIVGNVYSNGTGICVYSTSNGPLIIVGNVYSNTNVGVQTSSSSTAVTITGNVYSGTAHGVANPGAATVTIAGNVTGGNTSGYGAYNSGGGTLVVTGDAIGGVGNGCFGVYNVGSISDATVNRAIGNDYGPGGLAAYNTPGLVGGYASGTSPKTKCRSMKFGPRGACPVSGLILLVTDDLPNSSVEFVDSASYAPRTFYPAENLGGLPNIADVRSGVVYNFGSYVGDAHIPEAASVLSGVPVDHTTGTATVTPESIRAALGMAAATMDTQLAAIQSDAAMIQGIHDRIVWQVPDGPVAVIPAPSGPTKTIAWAYCYDVHGALAAGIEVVIRMRDAVGSKGAYSAQVVKALSGANGIATLEIPRNPKARFDVRRGAGPWIEFSGVDADSIELPAVIG